MANKAQLQGLRVLVTRPRAQQAKLAAAIEAAGGEAIAFPLIAIEPISDGKRLALLRQQIQQLDNYQLLIFVSTNAAQFGAELIDAYWPQFPVGVAVLAVGPTTAQEARRQLSCQVEHSPNGMDSEALLALPLLQQVNGKRIAIFRGQGGRELLAETLRSRGAQVDYFEAYQRRPVTYPQQALVNIIRQQRVNVLSVTSGESLSRLRELAGNSQDAILLPLVVPSRRIAKVARDMGFTRVYNAEGANNEALLACLQEIAARADN